MALRGLVVGIGATILLVAVLVSATSCGAVDDLRLPAADGGATTAAGRIDDGGSTDCDAGVHVGSSGSDLSSRCIPRSEASLFSIDPSAQREGYAPPTNPWPENSGQAR